MNLTTAITDTAIMTREEVLRATGLVVNDGDSLTISVYGEQIYVKIVRKHVTVEYPARVAA